MVQMETNFNFKSQICTDRFQSERLLSLGLKRETADMCWMYGEVLSCNPPELTVDIPAWSLHRLLCLYGQDYEIKELYNSAEECYGMLITAIGRAIENEDFNEEYLNKEE